jgi:GMP synthase (glutamine-hydrolysing)
MGGLGVWVGAGVGSGTLGADHTNPVHHVMKPVLILQHLSADGPAYFSTWLQGRGIAFDLRNSEAGQAFPADLTGHSALAVLGGEMSANDPLPSLRQAEVLIRDAMATGKPVIGHCLGGQLMARALGARVVASPAPEVGWQPLAIADSDLARHWFGHRRQATVFQWHYESFELPPGAELLAGSAACPRQAYAIGPHLAMQFHIEVDADKVRHWSHEHSDRWLQLQRDHATVQGGQALRDGLPSELAAHQALADRLYATWWQGVESR